VKVSIVGIVTNTTPADGIAMQGSFGTGASPANGAAAAGTLFGNQYVHSVFQAATAWEEFVLEDVITGLVAGTSYWFDVQLNVTAGGTAEIGNCTFVAYEVS
jgi:hypothetical protein